MVIMSIRRLGMHLLIKFLVVKERCVIFIIYLCGSYCKACKGWQRIASLQVVPISVAFFPISNF